MPWRDRTGAFSPFKALVLAALFVPALLLAQTAWENALGPKPWQAATHDTGTWAIRVLLLSLLITPARQVLRQARIAEVRRMVGVACFAYALLHLGLYAGDNSFDLVKVASEIIKRIYLTIGFVALAGLALLAATSTDAMLRRMGGVSWRRLHRLVYPLAALALVHFTLQSHADGRAVRLADGLSRGCAGRGCAGGAGVAGARGVRGRGDGGAGVRLVRAGNGDRPVAGFGGEPRCHVRVAAGAVGGCCRAGGGGGAVAGRVVRAAARGAGRAGRGCGRVGRGGLSVAT